MKALALLIALIGVVAAEVVLDERFSDGGKKKIHKVFPFFPDIRLMVERVTCQG